MLAPVALSSIIVLSTPEDAGRTGKNTLSKESHLIHLLRADRKSGINTAGWNCIGTLLGQEDHSVAAILVREDRW